MQQQPVHRRPDADVPGGYLTRTLASGLQAEIDAQSARYAHLFQIESSGGTTRFATTAQNISWDSQTWTAIGGLLVFSSADETPDPSGQGLELTLSGVDQTIISILLNNNMRGREVRIWLAHFTDTLQITADPLEIFRGRQLSDYTIAETRPASPDQPGSVTVTTRVQSHLAILNGSLAVLCTEHSHNDMLKRAGLSTGDTFMRNLLAIAGKPIKWGPQWVERRRYQVTVGTQ